MAVTAITATKYDAKRWDVEIEVDGDTINKRITIPAELPEGFATNKAWLKAQVKRTIRVNRNRKQSADDAATESAKWEGSSTNEVAVASEILGEAQTELDT